MDLIVRRAAWMMEIDMERWPPSASSWGGLSVRRCFLALGIRCLRRDGDAAEPQWTRRVCGSADQDSWDLSLHGVFEPKMWHLWFSLLPLGRRSWGGRGENWVGKSRGGVVRTRTTGGKGSRWRWQERKPCQRLPDGARLGLGEPNEVGGPVEVRGRRLATHYAEGRAM